MFKLISKKTGIPELAVDLLVVCVATLLAWSIMHLAA